MVSIELSEIAYRRLMEIKREDESVDELIIRLTSNNDLRKLIGIIPKDKVDRLDELIIQNRAKRGEDYQ